MATVLGCTCCARPWERCPVEAKRVGLRGPARDPDNVCRDCMAHAGFGLQMAKEHAPLWQGYVAQVEAEARERLAEAEGRFARAQRELAKRPERVVEKYILRLARRQVLRAAKWARPARGSTLTGTAPPLRATGSQRRAQPSGPAGRGVVPGSSTRFNPGNQRSPCSA